MSDYLDFFEDEEQKENGEDLKDVNVNNFSSAVVSSTDWTTETIINQINKNNIQLNPNFQRRDAWDKKRKSRFIESLILGLPIPQLVLAERKDQRGAYIVLDGKQRLLSIRQFAANNNDDNYEQLKLQGLDIRVDLKGKSLTSLREDALAYDDLAAFENQPIRTVVIKNWPNEDFLYHVFLRLNTGSVPLSPQELRQALHPGAFVSKLDELSTHSTALKDILKIQKPDFRMRDSELMLRYIGFKNFLPSYSGNLKLFLDDTCKTLNQTWDDVEENITAQAECFELAHKQITSIFGRNSYRKWSGNNYENKFNRAIFDIMLHVFSYPEALEASRGKEALIEQSFQNLCSQNASFLSSIETTTKSLTATSTRFREWVVAMNNVLELNLPVPHLHADRIVME